MTGESTDIAVIGAGLAGIATAEALTVGQGLGGVVLIDSHAPMALTSAVSGDNYRNWWPHPAMRRLTDLSIDRIEALALATGNRIGLTRRGYLLCTRERDLDLDGLLEELRCGYGAEADELIRIHRAGAETGYQPPDPDWKAAPEGVDILANPGLIARTFPGLDPEVATAVHIRRAGDLSGQQLGQVLIERFRAAGGRLMTARVRGIAPGFRLELETPDGPLSLQAPRLVNAAGPFLGEIAAMLGVELPVETVLQQKLAFEDRLGAIRRDRPFIVDLDAQHLDWTAEERALIAEDPALAPLAGRLPGGLHCRPEGAGRWVKLGWALNRAATPPRRDPTFDPHFPEIVLRGAARLEPQLRAYYGALPGARHHYGGYYTMTPENWPLIGPMGFEGAFVAGALSGFGTMAACAAGALCAAWAAGDPLPEDAAALSPARYDDPELMEALRAAPSRGIL